MVKKRAQYSAEALDTAVDQVIGGRPTKEVSQDTCIAYSTLRKHVVTKANGDTYEPKRRGPPPLLPVDAEESLTEWIVGRQVGHPVERQEVIRKACAMAELMFERGVSDGWYKRFMQRHPILSTRTCQFLTKSRNSVDVTDVHMLIGTMTKLIIEGVTGLHETLTATLTG
ncbi:hypothetical protein PHMEG_00036446 [Phytophthora megakarya]|uniref:HTH CENPB-type domain-containing protein n=1 Tax=Phytophthora megakarya TaxID=4795 RepID=A0A225UN44_9STRA|nr:hypothetical protein PHMEG_00036446 [Phytophthora megakarya]